MSGIAQRPVLSFEGIDREKAIAMVRTNARARFPLTPYFKDAALSFAATPVSDLWNAPYDRPHLASTCHSQGFVAIWGERTATFKVEMGEMQELIEAGLATNGWRYVWKVLQGDEKKVRIVAEADDASKARIEVDYHRAFDAPLVGGRTIKTSRVDIGCFLLDERGRQWSSEELSLRLYEQIALGQGKLTFLLFCPYGTSKAVQQRADVTLSLSKMTFTHEMALLLLTEQLYRAAMIHSGSKYHH